MSFEHITSQIQVNNPLSNDEHVPSNDGLLGP